MKALDSEIVATRYTKLKKEFKKQKANADFRGDEYLLLQIAELQCYVELLLNGEDNGK